MGVRVCKRCGREYRGLVCQGCHPKGSGERGRTQGRRLSARESTSQQVTDYSEYWLCACGECVRIADQVCPVCGVRRPPLAQMFGGKP